MRVVARVSDNMQAILDAGADEISSLLRDGIEAASKTLLDELRGQVRSAGLGAGLEKAWRREVYPRARRRTFHPAALVYSKSTILHDAFDRGPTISPRRAYLVIPTEIGRQLGLGEVGSSRKGGAVPGGKKRRYADLRAWADRIGAEVASARQDGERKQGGRGNGPKARVVLMPAKKGGLVAVLYRRGSTPVVVARLVSQVKLRKVLDIDGAEERAEAVLTAALAGG